VGMVETEIINAWLGAKPFVLVELDGRSTGDGEDDFEVIMQIKFGGGIGTSGAMGVLAEVLEQRGWWCQAPDGFDPDAED